MQKQQPLKLEFVALMASLMSIVALSIDALLPALPDIGADLNVVDTNNNQLLITMIFLGLGFGQLLLGPLSDAFGFPTSCTLIEISPSIRPNYYVLSWAVKLCEGAAMLNQT